VENLGTFLPILLIGVVFYLLIMRPARTRQRKQSEMMAALEPGTQVMLTAGVFGTLVTSDGDEADVEIAPGVIVHVVKAAIGKVVEPESHAASDAPTDEPATDENA
jgi:preprotein translocase subunit YajC